MRITRFSLFLFSAFLAGIVFLPMQGHAAGTQITVTQETSTAGGALGSYTIIKPDASQVNMTSDMHVFDALPAGRYTLIATPPEGATASLFIFRSGQPTVSAGLPQATLDIVEGEAVTVQILHSYSQVGTVSVQSSPNGLSFTLKGPNNIVWTGVTPSSFEKVPEGQYAATFDDIDGCPKLSPVADKLTKDSRIALTVTINCPALKERTSEETNKQFEFVQVLIDGVTVTFEDVPLGTWFASAVADVARMKILSGYKDREGNPTGVFGPDRPVTVAELAKVAHKIAGIDETEITNAPANARARNTWYSGFVASAESRHWLLFRDASVDPLRPATRAEVVATILQALDVQRLWPQGELFDDVPADLPYADCIETAAADGLVTIDARFRPQDPINRAELAKLVIAALSLYSEDNPEIMTEAEMIRRGLRN